MIDIATLSPESVGAWVEYNGSAGEVERGKIKSWNDQYIFVVYKCDGNWHKYRNYTGVATSPSDLKFFNFKSNRQ